MDLISRKDAVSRISDLLMQELKGQRIPTWNEVYNAIGDIPSVPAVPMKIDKTPTASEWVSVKERLPKDGQDVLAYLNDGEETRIAPCNYYNSVWFDSVMNCVVVLQDITHWMPLPEPPKEDT